MNIVLLSGGSGKRLWPLSNDIRSKQFIKIFKNASGEYSSMVQMIYNHLHLIDEKTNITIATSKTQVSTLRNQLGDDVSICVEPCRRDTFPAVALACAYLHDVKKVPDDEVVVCCPVDPYVHKEYFEALYRLGNIAQSDSTNLYLMGIKPTYPSEKYGYIIPETADTVSKVTGFKEKPDAETAKGYIDQGALWNGGIFAFRIGYIMKKTAQITGFDRYDDLYENYASLEKISFDYAVSEKENDIKVMLFTGEWKDLGTWNTLTEAMDDECMGNVVKDDSCSNVHIINELDIPILCMGMKDAVITASHNGILVSDKNRSSFIKPYVDKMTDLVMFAEKSWGSYKVIDVEDNSLVIKVTLNPGHSMHYHSHEHRDEIWNIISGTGIVVLNDQKINVASGDVIRIKAGDKHTVSAISELCVIETQIGNDINVNDKIKYRFEM